MKKIFVFLLSSLLMLTLAFPASAATLSALHPADTQQAEMTAEEAQALFEQLQDATEKPLDLHPAASVERGITLEELLNGHEIHEITNSTGFLSDGTSVQVTFYSFIPEISDTTESETLLRIESCPIGPGPCSKTDTLGISVVRDENGEIYHYIIYFGCSKCGSVWETKIVWA